MAYKKYITRGGKTYGPYIYHSRRENGKVVTDYHGRDKKDYHKFVMSFIYVFVGIILVLGFYSFITTFNFDFGFTGMAVLQLATDYQPNETVEGILRLSLFEGELIPADSMVLIDLAGEEHNYLLSDFIDGSVDGNFYIKDSEILGNGLGFGTPGILDISSEVNFELVLEDVVAEEISEDEPEIPEEIIEKENIEESEQEIVEEVSEEEVVEDEVAIESGTESETSTESASESEIPEEIIEEENIEESEQEIVEEVVEDEVMNEEIIVNEEIESDSASVESSETPTESASEPESAGITGAVVRMTGYVAKMTGFASLDVVGDSVFGSTSYANDFEFEIPEGKTVSIKSGTIFIKGVQVSDDIISLKIEDGKVIVSTIYTEQGEEGFGVEYLGSEKINFDVDLTPLNLTAREGVMVVKIIYGDNVIVETSSDLSVSLNDLDEIEFVNVTINNSVVYEDIFSYNLTLEEKNLLKEKAGTDIVNITKAVVENNRLIMRYELGDYWIEYSYDDVGVSGIRDLINIERKQWLKNLAKQLKNAEEVDTKDKVEIDEELKSLVGDFDIDDEDLEVPDEPEFGKNISI